MSKFRNTARMGLPFTDELLIDSHCHLGHAFRNYVPYNSFDEIIANMDRIGIDAACVCTFEAGCFANYALHNDLVAEYVNKSKGRLMGYATLNCNYRFEVMKELMRCESMGLNIGVKMHSYRQEYKIDDDFLLPVYEHLNEKNGIVLHHFFGEPERLEILLKAFPGVTFIEGHLLMQYAYLAEKYDNFYIDTCATLACGELKALTGKIGSEKILYGSDFVALDSTFGFGPVVFADITDEEKRNILGRNMRRLLKKIR